MAIRQTYFFDQGDAQRAEDGLIRTSNFVGVVDAVGTPHNAQYPYRLYDGLSSGEKAARTAEAVFYGNPNLDPRDIVPVLNDRLLAFQKDLADKPELLAGICLAAARLNEDFIEILQIGDTFAVIEDASGKVTVNDYRSSAHEIMIRELRGRIFTDVAQELYGCKPEEVPEKERSGFRQAFWEKMVEPWIGLRRLNCNNINSPSGYGLFNGQKESLNFIWYRQFPSQKIKRILLCTDGMVSPDILDGGNNEEIGQWLSENFNQGGWPNVLQKVRSIEKKREGAHYTSASEATGYSLTFS